MKTWAAVFALVAVAGGIGFVGWRTFEAGRANTCDACLRTIHSHSAVWGEADGDSKHFCCAACALRAQAQTGEPVEITEVADYTTERRIDPSGASFVVGSDVNFCLYQRPALGRQPTVFDQAKEAGSLDFDRCSPSVLAFADPNDAKQFAERHGGRIATFNELRGVVR